MNNKILSTTVLLLFLTNTLGAQVREHLGFEKVSMQIQKKLEASLVELSTLREKIANEKIGRSRELSALEAELIQVRSDFQEKTRLVDRTTLDMETQRNSIKKRKDETSYLANLLGEYLRNFESRIHVTQLQRYGPQLRQARLAGENSRLSDAEVFHAQAGILETSLDRIEEDLGGAVFAGSAIDSTGLLSKGSFALLGPVALFRSSDGKEVGLAVQRLGSTEPTVTLFGDPADRLAAGRFVEAGFGDIPVDPTMGNAYKSESTQESFVEQVQKGGPVMIPIFTLAGIALLVALWRWLVLASIRRPASNRIDALLDAVRAKDSVAVEDAVAKVAGPSGKMLSSAVKHIEEPRELLEEVMYEKMLATRLRVNSYLPFIAISAASAPLLGLLGTVTGIINTFKLITIHGSSDVQMLSGGISEALITTKFGLVVAIPSLLIHAYLSRKAKGVVSDMEKTAIRFSNEVEHTRVVVGQSDADPTLSDSTSMPAPQDDYVRAQVRSILGEMLGPIYNGAIEEKFVRRHAE